MRRAWRSSLAPGSTHTTKRGRDPPLVKVGLDLDALAPNAVRLEPLELRRPDSALREEAYECVAFEFAPATFAISFCELTKNSNAPPNRDNLDLGDLPDDLEVHAPEILPHAKAPWPQPSISQRA